ncbi:MAG: ABC transporter substrate-binding protein [Ardenticatenales bacterium]|nr:ABC transporter substrate-binding protein [Ardenticatenales bacterium]
MRRSLLALFLVLVFLSACAGAAGAPPEPDPTPIIIPTRTPMPDSLLEPTDSTAICGLEGPITLGAVVSLSGSAERVGLTIRQGMELALEEINAQHYIGPQAELQLLFEDDESDKDAAARAFRQLIEEQGVVGILGPTLSTSSFQAAPVAQAFGIPVMSTSNTAAGITEIGSYIFRNSLPDADLIPNTINAVREEYEFETVAILYGDDDLFTEAGFAVMQRAAESQELQILGVERFATGDTDFSEQLTRIQALAPDALLVSANQEEAAAILIQARALGIAAPIVGGSGFSSPTLLSTAGPAAEGLIVGSAWFISNPLPENITFVDGYRAKFDSEPDQFAAQAYTGVWLYAHALRNACSDHPRDIRDALGTLRLVPTPLGKFSFTRERNPLHPPVVLMVKDGEFTLFRGNE